MKKMKNRSLPELLKGVNYACDRPVEGIDVSRVVAHSSGIQRGDLFVAIRGFSFDGHDFIDAARSNGAVAVVCEKRSRKNTDIPRIIVQDARMALAKIADNFYGHPSKRLKVIGVTGTNGKTTITYLLEKILETAGFRTGVIGTVNYRFAGRVFDSTNTTPDPLSLERFLSEMVREDTDFAVMEVSSHSLEQRRIAGIEFQEAVFTNITREHLDYHKTMKRYLAAKRKIFRNLSANGTALLNADDPMVRSLSRSIKKKVLTFGLRSKADIAADDIELSVSGSRFRAHTPAGSFKVRTPLAGRHNISNILACIAVSVTEDIDTARMLQGIESMSYVPGRLESVDAGQPFKVFVDYAHTQDALQHVLGMLREVAGSRIITVFGCGGNRDATKRPFMGKVACRLSDRVIITSDNPRREDPARIIDDILKGVRGSWANYQVIEDRTRAIQFALRAASPGDIVLIAGKGHEKYQIIGDTTIPFDDCETVRRCLGGMSPANVR